MSKGYFCEVEIFFELPGKRKRIVRRGLLRDGIFVTEDLRVVKLATYNVLVACLGVPSWASCELIDLYENRQVLSVATHKKFR